MYSLPHNNITFDLCVQMKKSDIPHVIRTIGTSMTSNLLNWSYHRTYYYKFNFDNEHPQQHGGKRTGLSDEQKDMVNMTIRFVVRRHPCSTLKEISKFVSDTIHIEKSISWYCRFIASIGFTRKIIEVKQTNKYTSQNMDR